MPPGEGLTLFLPPGRITTSCSLTVIYFGNYSQKNCFANSKIFPVGLSGNNIYHILYTIYIIYKYTFLCMLMLEYSSQYAASSVHQWEQMGTGPRSSLILADAEPSCRISIFSICFSADFAYFLDIFWAYWVYPALEKALSPHPQNNKPLWHKGFSDFFTKYHKNLYTMKSSCYNTIRTR